jgi:hypothetical protein
MLSNDWNFEDICSIISLAMFDKKDLSGRLETLDLKKDVLFEREMNNL